MPVAKLSTTSTLDPMRSSDGNEGIDTLIGSAYFLAGLSRWPLLTPLQKCEKCSREFCSPINYRRHIRVHRRSLNVDKESHKIRDMVAAFWDKLSLEEAKEVVSFKDVMLKEVPGPSVSKALASYFCKPGVFPQDYLNAGTNLLDIIHAIQSGRPISSQKLFSILDAASERTFLCAGTAESVQKYVFDGEAGKVALELRNLVACTSFLFELKLLKAWLTDKDAEALRCQKLLVEEEEAAQKRQAELLERKMQKKLRQKEQKAREQSNGETAVFSFADLLEGSVPAETYIPIAPSDIVADAPEILPDITSSPYSVQEAVNQMDEKKSELMIGSISVPVRNCISRKKGLASGEAKYSHSTEQGKHKKSNSSEEPDNNDNLQIGINRAAAKHWRPVSRHGTRGLLPIQRIDKDSEKCVTHEKPDNRTASDGSCLHKKSNSSEEPDNDNLQSGINRAAAKHWRPVSRHGTRGLLPVQRIDKDSEKCVTHEKLDDRTASVGSCLHKKSNSLEVPDNNDNLQSGINRAAAKHWRPVSRHGTRGLLPVQRTDKDSEKCVTHEKLDDRTASDGSCLQSSALDDDHSKSRECFDYPTEGAAVPSHFSSDAAKAFLAERWKEAISSDHVTLVLSAEPEPPGGTQNDFSTAVSVASDSRENSVLGDAENQVPVVDLFSSSSRNAKGKVRTNPEKVLRSSTSPNKKLLRRIKERF